MFIIVLTLIGKMTGFIKELMIANYYGASIESDVFFFAFGLTSILFSAIGGSIGTTFIPMYLSIKDKEGKESSNIFANKVLNLVFIASIFISIVAIMFSREIITIFAPGFLKLDINTLNWVVMVTRIMMISIIFIGLQNIMTSILNANREYIIGGTLVVIFNLVCILYMIFLNKIYKIDGLFISVVIAFALQVIINIPKLKKHKFRYKFNLNMSDKYIKDIIKSTFPVMIGNSVNQINMMVEKAIVSLLGIGVLSILNYANKINLLIYGIISTVINGIVFSEIANCMNKNDVKKLSNIISIFMKILYTCLIPICLFMFIYSEDIIRVIFMRGEFTEYDVKVTSEIFRIIIPTMFLYSIRDLILKIFYSIRDTKTPMINGVIVTVINIILSILLSRIFGINGVVISSTLCSILSVFLLNINLNKKMKFKFKIEIKLLIKCISIYSIIYLLFEPIINKVIYINIGGLLMLVVRFLVYILVYIFILIIFKVINLEELISILKR